jgi:hypothetical protein
MSGAWNSNDVVGRWGAVDVSAIPGVSTVADASSGFLLRLRDGAFLGAASTDACSAAFCGDTDAAASVSGFWTAALRPDARFAGAATSAGAWTDCSATDAAGVSTGVPSIDAVDLADLRAPKRRVRFFPASFLAAWSELSEFVSTIAGALLARNR